MKSWYSLLVLILCHSVVSADDAHNALTINILISDGKTQRVSLEEIKYNSYFIPENIISSAKISNVLNSQNSNALEEIALLENGPNKDVTTYESINQQPWAYNTIDNNLVAAFYNFRNKFDKGIPEMNIPILDPYKANDATTDLKNKVIQATIQLSDLNIHGLKEVEVSYITLKLVGLYLNFELALKKLVIDGKYKINGKAIKIVPFSNNGDLRVDINDIHVIGSTKISVKEDDKTLYLEQFDINILNGDIQVKLNPAGKILGWILKLLVQSMTAEIAETQKQKLEQELKTNVWTKANNTLSKYTLKTLLEELSKMQ